MIHLTGYTINMDAASYDLTGSTDCFGFTDPQRSACRNTVGDGYVESERANCAVRTFASRNVPTIFLDERSLAMRRRNETLPVQLAAHAFRKTSKDIDHLDLAEALQDQGKRYQNTHDPWRNTVDGSKHEVWHDVHLRAAVPPIDAGISERLRMPSSAFVHIVDDEKSVREALGDLLESMDYQVALYASAADFLKVELPNTPACLVLDVRLPDTSGLELQEHLASINVRLPVILMTGFGDIPMTVRGMKLGALDFLTKPVRDQDLLDSVAAAIRLDQDRRRHIAQAAQLRGKYALLTARERQVMRLVASGLLNKQVAAELSISEVTVKMHRGSVMRKLEAKSVAVLARMAGALDLEG